MIIRQQKTLSNNHYISTWKNAKTAFFITICAAESGMVINMEIKNDKTDAGKVFDWGSKVHSHFH
ncbi:MAG: hypothetical protein NC337_01980 [Roseburia sp.]|nr:hypothetical protein [Roseburia sp.]